MSTPNYKILVSDKLGQDGLDVLEAAPDAVVDINTGLSEDELEAIIGDYDALVIRSGTQVTSKVLEAGSKLRVVGRAGVGTDNVDVDLATRKGVIVMNTPEGNTIATAEQTMTLLLASARNVVPAHNSMAEGRWDRSLYTGIELSGKVLGVIGFGRVGRAVAVRAQAFGMSIMAYDPYVAERVGLEANIELADLDEVLAASDFVTLHTALSADTENLINSERLATMKPGATLINVARGGLVDVDAVAAALEAGTLRTAAIDVFVEEPPEANHPLVGNPKVIHTPHLGASTAEAQRSVAIEIADQVLDALRGTRITNSVNLAFPPGLDFARVSSFINLASKIGRMQFAMADGPIHTVELELYASDAEELMRPVASGLLKGVVETTMAGTINFVNAPVIANERGIKVSRSVGLGQADYQNQITCRVSWDGGERTISGSVFSDDQPRIVQVSSYRFEADPTGTVLLMMNDDVPGVIGTVGTVLGDFGINIAEWRLGRNENRTEALSFINLDVRPDPEIVAALEGLEAVNKATIVDL